MLTHRAFATLATLALACQVPSLAAAEVSMLQLVPHRGAEGPGGGLITLDEVIDGRCRAAEHCGAADAASRDAVVRLSVQAPNGLRYLDTLAIGAAPGQPSRAMPARARMGDWLVELLSIKPEGRELPADGPGRLQKATVRVTPADRVALGVGVALDLPRSGLTLRVLSIDDHRCPPGVACGVAGHVQVETEISVPGAPVERMTWGAPADAVSVRTWRGHDIAWCGVSRPSTVPLPLQADFFISPAVARTSVASSLTRAGPVCSPRQP